jgi:hypothetical protein
VSWQRALLAALLVAATAPRVAARDPALELYADNLRATAFSAHLRVTAVERASEIRPDDGRTGLVVFRVSARALEVWKGRAAGQIDYLESCEAPLAPPAVGAEIVASLARRADGQLFVPDNGYVFPATPELLAYARRLGDARDDAAAGEGGRAEPSTAHAAGPSQPAACADRKPCREHAALHGACFRVRGRMSVYNGAPSVRIWPVGSARLLGVSQQRFADPAICNLPDTLARQLSPDDDVFADFEVCPFTAERAGVMRLVCVDSASRVTRRPHRPQPVQ